MSVWASCRRATVATCRGLTALFVVVLVPACGEEHDHYYWGAGGGTGVPPFENGIPVAYSQSVTTEVGVPVDIELHGWDPEGHPLTYSVTEQPDHGVLNGAPPFVTYTSFAGFTGADEFWFRVSDGVWNSSPASVAVDVMPIQPTTSIGVRTVGESGG